MVAVTPVPQAGTFDKSSPSTARMKLVAQAARNGSVSGDGHSSLSGYSIISADSLDAAIALAMGCPVLSSGATIEVCETFEAM